MLIFLLLTVILIFGCGRKGEPKPLWPENGIRDCILIGEGG